MYRRYKHGKLSKDEFLDKLRAQTVHKLTSLVLGAGGTTAGYALGTFILPGAGSLVGAVVGGVIVGYYGQYLILHIYEKLTKKMEKASLVKKGLTDSQSDYFTLCS